MQKIFVNTVLLCFIVGTLSSCATAPTRPMTGYSASMGVKAADTAYGSPESH